MFLKPGWSGLNQVIFLQTDQMWDQVVTSVKDYGMTRWQVHDGGLIGLCTEKKGLF